MVPLHHGWGIFLVRVTMGTLFAVHGYEKFARGIGSLAASFARAGIPAPTVVAPLIAGLELCGGILLILGLATRLVSLLFAIEMFVTTVFVQIPRKGWDGADLDRMLLAVSLLLVLAGPGALAFRRHSSTFGRLRLVRALMRAA